jgi:hypothetical protein
MDLVEKVKRLCYNLVVILKIRKFFIGNRER